MKLKLMCLSFNNRCIEASTPMLNLEHEISPIDLDN